MKKFLRLFFALGILVLFLFLIYKVFDIFGFWTLVLTGLISFFASFYLTQLARSRNKVNDMVTFNPKEWPKLLNILVSLSIGIYLLMVLNNKAEITDTKDGLSKLEYAFGLSYLIFLTFIPLIKSIITLVRDRNDFISITPTIIKYKDNDDVGEFFISEIKEATVIKGDIVLITNNDESFTIRTSNMNFGKYDIADTLIEIKNQLNRKTEAQIINI